MIKRHLKPLILDALLDFPVVAILGARQVGKSTLAQDLSSDKWPARYLSFDDFALLEMARRDPDGFVDGLSLPVILDEVQRVPDLLQSIKRVVDKNRKPGSFLLTGSANLLTLRSVSESLAGRVALFELHPFSWPELNGFPSTPKVLDDLFECRTAKEFIGSLPTRAEPISRTDFAGRILAGGFPSPALMKKPASRTRWFNSYRQTYLERDLREVTNVIRLGDFHRLLVLAASNTGRLLNTAGISRDLGIPLSTVRRHLSVLETTYQVSMVMPYFVNIGKRLVKTPKLFFNDTGLASNLNMADDWETLEHQGRAGAMVETWAASELRKLAGLAGKQVEIYFWRTHAGREVDFLIARGGYLAAIEVKWSQKISNSDLSALESCRQDLKGRLGLAVILYAGENALALNDHIAAVPLWHFFTGRGTKTKE